MTGRSDILTHQDLVAARAGSWIEFGEGLGRIVKQRGGSWRQKDASGQPVGRALTSSEIASRQFLRRELHSPEAGAR